MDSSPNSGHRTDALFRREFQKKRSSLAEERVSFERLYEKFLALYEDKKKSHDGDISFYQPTIDNLTHQLARKNDTLTKVGRQLEGLQNGTVELIKEVTDVKNECIDDCRKQNGTWEKIIEDENEKHAKQLKARDEIIKLLQIEVSLLNATLSEVKKDDMFDIESLTGDEGSEFANGLDE